MKKKIVIVSIILVIILILLIIKNNKLSVYLEEQKGCSSCYILKSNKNINIKNNQIKNEINEVLKQEIDFDNTILIYNKYNNSTDIYFKTEKKAKVKYSLDVNNKHYEKILYDGHSIKKIHHYKLTNIKYGYINNIKLELIENDKISATNNKKLDLTIKD